MLISERAFDRFLLLRFTSVDLVLKLNLILEFGTSSCQNTFSFYIEVVESFESLLHQQVDNLMTHLFMGL